MKRIILFPIEPIETRYTCEWYTHLPKQLVSWGFTVIGLDGKMISTRPSEGAFLDFSATNVYKSSQLISFAENVLHLLDDNDVIMFSDAWNPCAIQVRYMLDLAGKKCKMVGLWHAGSYDPQDFLGRAFDKRWSFPFEQALFNMYDMNAFATNYSSNLFLEAIPNVDAEKAHVVGWPMEYLKNKIERGSDFMKKDIVLFPHRISPEKKPEVFRALAKIRPQYEFVFCQEQELTKFDYHEMLRSAKVVFSASMQETLGIGVYEGLLAGAAPLMPHRLSYGEIWGKHSDFMYQSGLENTEGGLEIIARKLDGLMGMDDQRTHLVNKALADSHIESFFDGKLLYERIENLK